MKALRFLLFRTWINRLKTLVENPAKLILTIVFSISIVLFIVVGFLFPPEQISGERNPYELIIMILILYAMLFITSCFRGLHSGAAFFSMADANYLFTSPLSSRKILNYGLLKQLGATLFVGLFLVFQYAWLRQTYNIDIWFLFLILAAYTLSIFISQLTSLAVYAYTSGNSKRKRTFKIILYTYLLALIIYILVVLIPYQNDVLGVIDILTDGFMFFVPVAGWLSAFVYGVWFNVPLYMILGGSLSLVFFVLLVVFIYTYQPDYYEDVLKTTETNFSAINARKEGKAIEALPINIRKGKIGFIKGEGAWVYFHKHLKEDRRAKVFFIDASSLLFITVTIIFAYFLRANGIIPGFFFAIYIAIFIGSQSRWIREMNLPYIYLTPAPSFIKLIAVIVESIRKVFLIAIIQFFVMGIVTQAPLWDVLIAMLGYVSFHVLFIGVTILSERIFGRLENKSIAAMLYFALLAFLIVPGIIGGFVVASFGQMIYHTLITISIMTLWQLSCGILLIYLCRDILDYAELSNR